MTRGCVVEIIMKDNHTIGSRPENVVQWCRIAKEEARDRGRTKDEGYRSAATIAQRVPANSDSGDCP